MRNYFKTLQLHTSAAKEDVQAVLGMGHDAAKGLNPRHRADAFEILLEEERRQAYASTVKLYETLHSAASCLDEPGAKDTHRWKERLSEFDTIESENN